MINITATLERIIQTSIEQAPERILLKDWRGIALRMRALLDQEGLVITSHPTSRSLPCPAHSRSPRPG